MTLAPRQAPNTRLQAVHTAQAPFQSNCWAVRQVCECREQAHRAQHRRADREQRIAPVVAQRQLCIPYPPPLALKEKSQTCRGGCAWPPSSDHSPGAAVWLSKRLGCIRRNQITAYDLFQQQFLASRSEHSTTVVFYESLTGTR